MALREFNEKYLFVTRRIRRKTARVRQQQQEAEVN
jgi:hypothetical protein